MPKDNDRSVLIKDTLYNFSVRSGASNEYCKGLVVGIVAGYMSHGKSWEDSIIQVAKRLPNATEIRTLNADCLPIGWEVDIRSLYEAHQRNTKG